MGDSGRHKRRLSSFLVASSRVAASLVLMCVALVPCGATECAPEQIISDNAGRPSIDVGPSGAAWAVWEYGGDLYWCVDGGTGWSGAAVFGGGTRPVVSIDIAGTPWVVWRVSGGVVSKHWTGSSWTELEVVASGLSREGSHDVLARGPSDIWVASDDGGNTESLVWAYHWNGVEWVGPWELGLPGRQNQDPDLAVSPSGVVGLVWSSHGWPHGPHDIVYSEWDGSGWTAPAVVDTGDAYRRFPKLVYDGRTPMVLWQHEIDVGPDIVYSRCEAGVWSHPAKVSLPDGSMDWDNGLRCESNVAGDIVAVWHNYNGSQMWETPVVCSWWDSGDWSPEEKLSNDDPYKIDHWPDAALDSNGVLWSAWLSYQEQVPFGEFVRGTTCVRDFTPVDFALLEAVSDGPSVRLSWYAGGAAAAGPFWIWRSPTLADGLSCVGIPGDDAELLNRVAITSDPYVFTDSEAEAGPHCYWVEWDSVYDSVFLGPVVSEPGEVEDTAAIDLVSVWPNPSGDSVTASVRCPSAAALEVRIYSIAGRQVARLDSPGGQGSSDTGLRLVHWDGTDAQGNAVAAGVYVIRVLVNGEVVAGECAATTVLR